MLAGLIYFAWYDGTVITIGPAHSMMFKISYIDHIFRHVH